MTKMTAARAALAVRIVIRIIITFRIIKIVHLGLVNLSRGSAPLVYCVYH